jgi:hypothetical protein
VPMTLTVTNTGTSTLTVLAVDIGGVVGSNYTQTNNCSSVSVNNFCSINVTFSPTMTGTQAATLYILSNAASSPDSVGITGSAD